MTNPSWCNCEGVRCSACTEAEEVHREVFRHLVSEVARFQAERDRALACEAAALALLAEWREAVVKANAISQRFQHAEAQAAELAEDLVEWGAHRPSCRDVLDCDCGFIHAQVRAGKYLGLDPSPPPEGERCGERKGIWACDKCGCGNFEDRCIRCGSGRSGGSR